MKKRMHKPNDPQQRIQGELTMRESETERNESEPVSRFGGVSAAQDTNGSTHKRATIKDVQTERASTAHRSGKEGGGVAGDPWIQSKCSRSDTVREISKQRTNETTMGTISGGWGFCDNMSREGRRRLVRERRRDTENSSTIPLASYKAQITGDLPL